MPIDIKIVQGTGKQTGKPLCYSCTYSIIREDNITCSKISFSPLEIGRPIYDCNGYYNRNLPTLHALEEIAWTVSTSADRKFVGFNPPDKDKK